MGKQRPSSRSVGAGREPCQDKATTPSPFPSAGGTVGRAVNPRAKKGVPSFAVLTKPSSVALLVVETSVDLGGTVRGLVVPLSVGPFALLLSVSAGGFAEGNELLKS